MENRDRDKISDNSKTDSESNFGKDIGRSENWDSEPSRKDGSSSSWQGDSGRSSGSSSSGDRSNLGEQSDMGPSRSGSNVEH